MIFKKPKNDLLGITSGRPYKLGKHAEAIPMMWYWSDPKRLKFTISYMNTRITGKIPIVIRKLSDRQIIKYLQRYLPNKDRSNP